MNPQPSKLYSIVKLHKEENPIRSVVSCVTAPSYKLSKKLIQFYTIFKAKFSIKNSSELIHNIEDLHIPDIDILLSFGIKKLIS